jgi:hypothetical protein
MRHDDNLKAERPLPPMHKTLDRHKPIDFSAL